MNNPVSSTYKVAKAIRRNAQMIAELLPESVIEELRKSENEIERFESLVRHEKNQQCSIVYSAFKPK